MTANALGARHHTSASDGTPSSERPRISGALPYIGAGTVHVRFMIRDRTFAVNNTATLGVIFLVPAFLATASLLWA